jgi:hypothetical protein
MIELHFKVFRFDPQADAGPYFKHYQVKAEPGERILDCLNRIKWEQDGTLSYRMSCAHGVCGSDGMKINGTCRLACQAIVKDYQCPEVVLEPLPGFKVLKDLVVDIDPSWKASKFRPYLTPAPEKERIQTPEEGKDGGSDPVSSAPAARLPPGELDSREIQARRPWYGLSDTYSNRGIMNSWKGSNRSTIPMEPGAASTTSNVPASAPRKSRSPNPST